MIDATIPMTSAEFRILRERLGVEVGWLADEFGVSVRAVNRWETGQRPVSHRRADQIRSMVAATDHFIARIVAELTLDDDDSPVLLTYRSDAEYRREHPDLPWPAAWHRAAMGRVVERFPTARLRYHSEDVSDGPSLDDDDIVEDEVADDDE